MPEISCGSSIRSLGLTTIPELSLYQLPAKCIAVVVDWFGVLGNMYVRLLPFEAKRSITVLSVRSETFMLLLLLRTGSFRIVETRLLPFEPLL